MQVSNTTLLNKVIDLVKKHILRGARRGDLVEHGSAGQHQPSDMATSVLTRASRSEIRR